MKICRLCKNSKPYEDFRKKKVPTVRGWWYDSECRPCQLSDRKEKYHNESPTQRAKRRNAEYIRKYGITYDQRNQMFIAQNGLCLGCRRHEDEFKKKLSIDHDHATGAVRGLLCGKCNLAIGNAEDNPQTLRLLAYYLESRNR